MFQDRLIKFYNAILILLLVLLIASCSAEKFVADGKYMLDKVEIKSDVKDFDALQFAQLIRQKGNSRWFSFFKIPLGTYALSGRDTTKWINRTLQKMGEEPVLYDTLEAQRSKENLRVAMNNMGYMNATVDLETKVKGKKLKAIYTLHPGSPYQINSFNYDIQDSVIASLLEPSLTSKFDKNHPRQFIVSALDNERKRLTKILNDSGYYRFNKDFIYYTADSTKGSKEVDLTLHLAKYRTNNDSEPILHPRYIINKVNILPGNSTGVNLRKGVIAENNLIEPGRYFSSSDLQKTYNNFARLGAVRYTNIDFRELNSIENIIVGKTFNYQQSQKHYLVVPQELDLQPANSIG